MVSNAKLDSSDWDVWWSQVDRFRRELDSRQIEEHGRLAPDLLERAAHIGLFAIALPEAYGGLELGLSGACRLASTLAEMDRSVATSVGLHAGLGTRGLVMFGDEPLKRRYLPALASGQLVGAFAATEPNAGSDLMAVRTTGVIKDGCMRVDGEKCYVTNGGFAGLFTVLVRTPGGLGKNSHSLICIPRDTPGVLIGGEEHKLGIRASSTVTVSFEGACVPVDHILAPAGSGMSQAHAVLEWGRTLMSAGCVGTARTALAKTVEHVQQRAQFGRLLARFQAVRSQVADMAAELHAMETIVDVAAAHADAGRTIDVSSLQAKVFCSEGAYAICDRALQLHGAMGFLEDTGVARLSRDCRVTRIFEGANDVLLIHYGTRLLADRSLHVAPFHHGDSTIAHLGQELENVERHVVERILSLRKSHGVRAVHEQLLLQAVAKAHIDVCVGRHVLGAASSLSIPNQALALHAARLLAHRADATLQTGELAAIRTASASTVFDTLSNRSESQTSQSTRESSNPSIYVERSVTP